MVDLRCNDNSLTKLDVSKCPKLEFLYCFNNQIKSLDLSQNPQLYSDDPYASNVVDLAPMNDDKGNNVLEVVKIINETMKGIYPKEERSSEYIPEETTIRLVLL